MFNDTKVQNWIEEFGTATSFTFLVYGTVRDEELQTIIKGLVFHLQIKELMSDVAVFCEYIDEDMAVAWKTFQGTSITFVFGGDALDIESIINEIISDGLKYLRYKNDYLGHYRSDSYV